MANPNIATASSLFGKSIVVNLGTINPTGIVTNTSSSNQLIRVNAIRVTNIDGVSPADITISLYDASEMALGYLGYTISVVADTTLSLVDKSETVYLEEGDYIQATSSAVNDLSIYCSYEVIE